MTPRERGLLRAIEKATRQPLTEMALPSAADVNAQRVTRFHDAITAALEAPTHAAVKAIVLDYEREHDVPMADIAAALAIMSRDGENLLLPPDEVRTPGGDRGERGERRPKGDFARYRISVGRKQRVNPSQIVGAIANEGGLTRRRSARSTSTTTTRSVELPADMSKDTLEALSKTRIGDQLIQLRREKAGGPDRPERPHKPRPLQVLTAARTFGAPA